MTKNTRPVDIRAVFRAVQREFSRHRVPVVDLVEMQTKDPFKVLVTTILSARTKDETTTEASKRLYAEVRTLDELEKVPVRRLEKLIFPVGFYRTKARHLKKLPAELRARFGGRIPDSVEELVQLPGVGRKTANLVVAVAFGKPAICVDVHVHRICNRLGYLRTQTPFETEMKLREILPVDLWIAFNSCLVSFGQHTCFPVNPRCDRCVIAAHCNRVNVRTKYPPKSFA
jgi:endonuclease III